MVFFCFQILLQIMAYQGLSRHINLTATPSPGERFTLIDLIGEGTYGEVRTNIYIFFY